MSSLFTIFIIALIAEAVWETLKMTWQSGKLSIDRLGALAVGILIAFATGVDILSLVGITAKIPYIGIVFTGLLISRGSNFVHDLLQSISNVQKSTKGNGKKL